MQLASGCFTGGARKMLATDRDSSRCDGCAVGMHARIRRVGVMRASEYRLSTALCKRMRIKRDGQEQSSLLLRTSHADARATWQTYARCGTLPFIESLGGGS
jgi:hypothetical protein